jgi:hypothetical protein
VNQKGGKVITTQRNVVAADGKTQTVTTTGTDAQADGEQHHGVREAIVRSISMT